MMDPRSLLKTIASWVLVEKSEDLPPAKKGMEALARRLGIGEAAAQEVIDKYWFVWHKPKTERPQAVITIVKELEAMINKKEGSDSEAAKTLGMALAFVRANEKGPRELEQLLIEVEEGKKTGRRTGKTWEVINEIETDRGETDREEGMESMDGPTSGKQDRFGILKRRIQSVFRSIL